jgi:hypothetical protein
MEFKIKANLTLSKVLTIEADDLKIAVEMAQEQVKGMSMKEFTPSKLDYELLSGLEWMDESKLKARNNECKPN